MTVEVITIPKDDLIALIDRTVEKAVQRVLNPPDEVMNKTEVAKYLRRSTSTVTRYMRDGLPNRAGRFKRSEVDKWIGRG